jgi:glycosyltransferase involved in cell wall biosynthesis
MVLCQVFHPDIQSTSQLLSDVLAVLAQAGRKITVISGYPGMHDGRPVAAAEIWQGVTIRRGGMRASVKKGPGLRTLTYLSYSWHAAWRLLWSRGKFRVLVVTNPPFLPVLVWLMCRLRGHQFKVMLQDIYPDGIVAIGRVRSGGMVDRLWRAANYRAFRAANEVWVLGRDMAQLVWQRYQVPPEKIRYIPHWSAVVIANPTQLEEGRLWATLNLQGKFVVQYSGNMGLWHDIDTIVRAAALLRGRPDILFLLIGQGMRRKCAEQLGKEIGATNIIWLPYQDRGELEDSLACCHAALISQRAGLEGVAVPCKLYGILASGRAVIAQVPAGSEVALTVEEEQCGRIVLPGDAAALAASIVELEAAREETNRMGARAHAAYHAKYSLTSGAAAFERGFEEWPALFQ